MSAHGLVSGMLRALAGRDPAWPVDAAMDAELQWLVQSGLGPVAFRLVSAGRLMVSDTWRDRLHAADLMSVFRTRELIRTTEEVLRLLRQTGIESTLLKGIAVATCYYPEPHLRVMGDADLLIPREAIADAVQLLRDEGYTLCTFAAPEWWDTHHHAPPLTHPERDVTIELHHALVPPKAAARDDPPFELASVNDRLVDGQLVCEPVRRLIPECELALLAAAWGNDLSVFLGDPGLQRPLVDAVLLLSTTRDTFDWDRLLHWTAGTFTGACLWILLSLLDRHGALPCAPERIDVFRPDPNRLARGSVRMIHHLVRRHVMMNRPFGRVLTRSNTARVAETLMARGPAWRQWLAVPVNIAFPLADERRFHLGHQLRRIKSMLWPR